jgi:hypothetical protein
MLRAGTNSVCCFPCSYLWHAQGVLVRNFVLYPGTLEPGTRAWKESITMYRSYASGRVRDTHTHMAHG